MGSISLVPARLVARRPLWHAPAYELHPEEFAQGAEYCERHREYLDATIARFDREVQFYVACLELIGRMRDGGLPFCYPHVSTDNNDVAAVETFDIALAHKLVPDDRKVVGNDFHLEEPERIFVVSGPNNGGKTTFARTFGQLHHLAGLGLGPRPRGAAVPARSHLHPLRTGGGHRDPSRQVRGRAHPCPCDPRAGHAEQRAGDERELQLDDVERRALRRDRSAEAGPRAGALGLYVTFVDELASLGEATVSVVSQIVPENRAERTFKVLRKPADGLAYASAIAEKYRLTSDRLIERIDE